MSQVFTAGNLLDASRHSEYEFCQYVVYEIVRMAASEAIFYSHRILWMNITMLYHNTKSIMWNVEQKEISRLSTNPFDSYSYT
ncbi:CLUMA_CG001748, isoform A [Clunio marinus]|uniref:CLUMA_CG001748, isoform A n=1 Tax=Clunio marinus TaxID=568069 RepID=A0A1J1HK94_9DIPT|nr:CLUMA_CG001748, isoform A [Clunio marinus]